MILLLATAMFFGLRELLPNKIFSAQTSSKNVLIDSMLLDALDEADVNLQQNSASSKATKISFEPQDGVKFPSEFVENYHGYQYLISFFEKLYELEINGDSNVRIAYFGDSMTDGDMIVQDFRANFQEKFGGNGVGFVSITSESAASRSSISHKFSDNWKTESYLNIKYPSRPFGVNGHVFFANDTSRQAWVQYKAGISRFNTELPNPTLFYGSSKNKNAKIKVVVARDTIRKQLTPSARINTLQLSETSLKDFKALFVKADSIPIYGFNFQNKSGVYVDNFSQRGNSGIPISKFDVPTMNAFQEKLNYNLIVLHYGTNVLNYGSKNYLWYEKSMTKTINKLRESFPGVAILVISTADKATKYDVTMKTDSAVVPLITSQKNYAINTKSGFINLYTLMGGDGSIVKWVEEMPALANKDYTHFNYQGSRKVGLLLYQQLMEGYNQYKKLRKSDPTSKPNSRVENANLNMQATYAH